MATQSKIGQGIGIVLAVSVTALLIAFLLPIAMGAFFGPTDVTYNQTEGETVTLTGSLNGTLNNVSTTNNDIEVTIQDGTSSQTLSNIGVGANKTATINGEDITVTNDEIHDAANATVSYEYPTTYSWGAGATNLFNLVPLLLILAVFLFVVGLGLSAYKQA